MLRFVILNRSQQVPSSGVNTCYLTIDNWNDFSFITSFYLSIYDEYGIYHEIGGVKIGFLGQTEQEHTGQTLKGLSLEGGLPSSFFSLGIGSEYYQNLSTLNVNLRNALMIALRDVVFNSELIEKVENELVFITSLLREASISVIEGKYKRLLYGDKSNIPFHFAFSPTLGEFGNKALQFKVVKKPQPSLTTNVHALIGRNGTGKTTLLNKIVRTVLNPRQSQSLILDLEVNPSRSISKNYFSSIISVSFSSFDLEAPPLEQRDPSKGTCYSYIGLKKSGSGQLKTLNERRIEMCENLFDCFHNAESLLSDDDKKRDRFFHAVKLLSSDYSIKSFGLETLWDEYNCILNDFMRERLGLSIDPVEVDKDLRQAFTQKFLNLLPDMSSGHAIVLMTTFSLISKVDEKSLVLIDEPESHLHPPLLSAFIRTLSWLMNDVNGVSIIATHSPVVLQEVPSTCVWKIIRYNAEINISRPKIETFGENVGVLTREVFGLDVEKSGYITVIEKAVKSGMSFERIYNEIFEGSLGNEGMMILRSMLDEKGYSRD